MATIALIEKDSMQQEMLANLLSLHDPTIQVLSCFTGQSFLDANDHYKIDLLITELHLPDMDGLEIIQFAQNQSHSIPVIAIASNASDFQYMAKELGATETFEKPVNPDQLLLKVKRLLKLHQLKPLYNMTVEQILQVVSGDKKDCELTLLSQHQKGVVYFRSGQLIHAYTSGKEGDSALVEMLSWHLYHFNAGPIRQEVPVSIQSSLISILMNAAVDQDEKPQKFSPHTKPL